MLESLLCERGGASGSSGKRALRKDLDSNTLVAIENFMRMSYFWPQLLNLTGGFFYALSRETHIP